MNIPEDLNQQQELLDGLKLSLVQANELEEKPRLQYKSEAWLKEQKLRFTASKFGRVSQRQKNFEKCHKDMMNAQPVTTQSMEHGIQYEPVVLREYQHYREKLGCPVKVTQAGFFVPPKIFVLGC